MKKEKFGSKDFIYLMLTIGAIVAFLIVFQIDQLARCSLIGRNNNYEELIDDLFVPITMNETTRQLTVSLYNEALIRNEELFGKLVGEPRVIITTEDNEAIEFRGNYVGATHNSVFGLYVIIGPDGLNVDVLSHELAHSELSDRVGWYKTNKIPIWFNEGIATQVDHRSDYSLETWKVITNNGENIVEVKQFKTPKEFYNNNFELRVNNYTLAKQELRKWLDLVGSHGLEQIIVKFKEGEDLYLVYSDMLLESSKKIH